MSILDIIVKEKLEEVKRLKATHYLNLFNRGEYKEIKYLSFYDSLNKENRIALIAEIKQASPSKGLIKKRFNHLAIANSYIDAEVEAISVLTDEKFFMGAAKYLHDIAKIKTTPLLRKDFIIDDSQVYQAKTIGADAFLLITEILDKYQIKDYTLLGKELGMDVLLELHSEKQLDKIDFDVNKIIGINNRNLETFKVDINTTSRIAKYLPTGTLIVSESGIKKQEDIELLKQSKINAVLIGEQLMTSENIFDAVIKLKAGLSYES